jgi:hypothetical protein
MSSGYGRVTTIQNSFIRWLILISSEIRLSALRLKALDLMKSLISEIR